MDDWIFECQLLKNFSLRDALDSNTIHLYAKKIELDDITIIDYHNPEYNLMYNLRYIFDKKNSSLAITGDFGELVAVNFNNMGNWEDFYKDFTNNPGYFIEKIKASSRNLFVYDEEETKKIIDIKNMFYKILSF